MTFVEFLRLLLTRTWHSAWHLSHVVHMVIILAAGACVWAGVHFEEHALIWMPFAALIVALFFLPTYQSYLMFLQEHTKRAEVEAELMRQAGNEEKHKSLIDRLADYDAVKAENSRLQQSIDNAPATVADVRQLFNSLATKAKNLNPKNFAACQPWFDLCAEAIELCIGEPRHFQKPQNIPDTPDRARAYLDDQADWLRRRANVALNKDDLTSKCRSSSVADLLARVESL